MSDSPGKLRLFFSEWNESISGFASIITILVAIVGFALTIWQINRATVQIQSANEYNIRRDLRELVQKVRSDYFSDTSCLTESRSCADDDKRKADFGIGLIFNLHNSIFLQSESHGISTKFKEQMAQDFCSWFKLPAAESLWQSQVKLGAYGDDRRRMRVEWCQK